MTVHREFGPIISGPVFGEFTSHVVWLNRDANKVADDVRRFRFYRVPNARLFDFEIRMTSAAGPLVFGDDKEGTFGVRVASTMSVDQGKGKPPAGTIVNANGEKNDKTWGKKSPWVDYFGPLEGQTVGIAIFDHPSNLRHPTTWHVRTYGLFCANPFGLSFFTGDKKNDGADQVPEGQEFRQQYRLYIHHGDTESAKVADWYSAYADPPTVEVRSN